MNVKVIVKVMNFHSLLRVDSARKKAEKYTKLEQEVSEMIDIIMNNKNLILDKKIMKVVKNMPELNIYIGSDLSFCGSVNAQVNASLATDAVSEKIAIGKKVKAQNQNLLLKISTEDMQKEYGRISEAIVDSIEHGKNSKINVIYNHFNNASSIELMKKCIYPIELKQKENEKNDNYSDDFSSEGNVDELLKNLIYSYIDYEIKIAAVSSYASENIMRQNATSESLKKIEENEEQKMLLYRKERTQKEFKKVIESYTHKIGIEGEL